jgi:hypothetical protein
MEMTTQYIYLIIFFCLGYLIVTDPSIAKLVVYAVGLLRFQYEKIKWWTLHNPSNPVVKYLMWKRAMKLAKELQDEFRND